MEFNARHVAPEKHKTGCIIIGAYEAKHFTPAGKALKGVTGSALIEPYKLEDFNGTVGQSCILSGIGSLQDRILLVGCGKRKPMDEAQFVKILRFALVMLGRTGTKDALNCLTELDVKGRDIHWKARQIVALTIESLYRFDTLKSEKAKKPPLRKVTLLAGSRAEAASASQAAAEAKAIAGGVELARTLGNLPGNICTPSYLASEARSLAKKHAAIKTTVLGVKDMERLKMGSLLSVARGSREPAKLITLEYSGGRKGSKPVVLVGKGVTFDSGGISIKPGPAMDEMKFDMCGAASVLGTLQAAASMKLPINVVGVIPTTENLPDGNASKPGDIVTSMSGQTIEILNTDAEGRLILCDALTYCGKFKPDTVIDIATLTGACVIALGAHPCGLLSNDQALADDLLDAGQYTRDRAWQLPLWEDYQEQLKSNFADMANIGGREAGTVTAACFLARFTRDYTWAHLDIAGVAWKSGPEKGATGRPVSLLTQYLINKATAKKRGT
jgi:leucyl aminopeptidase